MTLTPLIIEETLRLCEVLQLHADTNDVVSLKKLADKYTIDIIGNVVLYATTSDSYFNTRSNI